MGTTTTTFALNKPTVGGDDNAWGTDWNTNADKLDDLLDGTTAIKPNLSEGLWKVGGVAVTATAAELNILDGVTASTAELNFVDGVTSAIQTQLDAKYDSGDLASQAEAEAGTDNTKLMTPLRVDQELRSLNNVLLGTLTTTSGSTQTLSGLDLTPYKFVFAYLNSVSPSTTATISIAGVPVTGALALSASIYGLCIIDLSNGLVVTAGLTNAIGGAGTVNNSSTSISVSVSAGSFDAGVIKLFGVR